MVSSKSILLFIVLLFPPFDLWSPFFLVWAAECGDRDVRSLEVATTCEADFDLDSSTEICPADCEPKLRAFYEDCEVEYGDLAFLVIATDNDACFDVVFDLYAEMRGSECEMNRKAFRPMWPILCISECTEECSSLVDGVCNHCSGVLESAEANSVQIELSVSAPHCAQSQCSLGESNNDGGSSNGSGDIFGDDGDGIEGDVSSAESSSSSGGGEGCAGRVRQAVAFFAILSSAISYFVL